MDSDANSYRFNYKNEKKQDIFEQSKLTTQHLFDIIIKLIETDKEK